MTCALSRPRSSERISADTACSEARGITERKSGRGDHQGIAPTVPDITRQQGRPLREQLAGMTAQQAWGTDNHPLAAVKDFAVIPAETITSGNGFNTAALVFATTARFTDEPDSRVALAISERQLLDLADEIQRKLRPTAGDRILDTIDALAEHIANNGGVDV